MTDIIKREVVIKRIQEQDLYIRMNENLAEKNDTKRPFNYKKGGKIWAKTDKNGQYVRAFTSQEEEDYYMPLILKKSKSTQDWNQLVDNFWRSVFIDWEGESLMLDTSFRLKIGAKIKLPNSKEEIEVSKDTFKTLTSKKPYLEWYFGEPVNLTDYWKWRFCLNTSQVANDISIATNIKAKNMEYYLYTKEEELKVKTKNNEVRLESNKCLTNIIGDDNKVEAVLRLFERNRMYQGKKFGGYYKFEDLDKEEKVELLLNISQSEPTLFINITNDTKLLEKSFIYKCIAFGTLNMPDGSTMVMYGDERLGNTVEESVMTLFKNPKLKDEISNRLGIKLIDVKKKVVEDSNKIKSNS